MAAEVELSKRVSTELEGNGGQYAYRGLDSIETEQVLKLAWSREGEVFDVLGRKLENLCSNCVYGIEFGHR